MAASTCENPQFPSWTWRYNRDKHLTRFEPWYTSVNEWPPRYRHMGVPYNFRFHPMSGKDAQGGGVPFQQLGVTYAKQLSEGRETGFGNAGLGNPPGPAPPRLALYNTEAPYPVSELYRVNEIHGISDGMSLWDYSKLGTTQSSAVSPALDPRQYLKETLGQQIEYPGTFPHFNNPQAASSSARCPARVCKVKDDAPRNPLDVWTERHRQNLRGHATERARTGHRFLPPLGPSSTPMYGQFANRPSTTGRML